MIKTAWAMGLIGMALVGVAWKQDCDVTQLCALVGPERGVYFRGQATLSGGKATVALPGYFETFTAPGGRTVQLTCVNGWSPLSCSPVAGGQFTVQTDKSGNQSQTFYWEVKAVCAKEVSSPSPANR